MKSMYIYKTCLVQALPLVTAQKERGIKSNWEQELNKQKFRKNITGIGIGKNHNHRLSRWFAQAL